MAHPAGYPCPYCATVGTYRNNLRAHLMGRQPKGHELSREDADRVISDIETGSARADRHPVSPETRVSEAGDERSPAVVRGGTAVTAGHRASLEMLQNVDAVRKTLDLYRDLATPAGVYLRPTHRGLTVISLDPECASMVGVGAKDSSEPYLGAIPPSHHRVELAAVGYRRKVAALRRTSTEERFALGLIRHALTNQLALPLGDLRFLCQEWRFPTSLGGGKLDLLAVDVSARQLVVIELKSTQAKAAMASQQAQGYIDRLTACSEDLYPYLSELLAAAAAVYGAPWLPERIRLASDVEPRFEVWWPDPTDGQPRSSQIGSSTTRSTASRPRDTPSPLARTRRIGSAPLGRPAAAVVELDDLARQHHAWVSSDSPFQRRLRLMQAKWREEQGYPIGAHNGHPLGSRLLMPDGEQELWNFLTPAIGTLVREEYEANLRVEDKRFRKMYGYPRLFDDLLSSQPLCFNLFGPLALDLQLATEVGRRVWPDRVDRVTAVRFEHSPGRWDGRYLNNGTAADVLIEHTLPGAGHGVIAVETKYHEDMSGKANVVKPRYSEVVEMSGAFTGPLSAEYHHPPLQQVLLDHLLVLATRATDQLDSALFVLASPAANSACTLAATTYASALDEAAPVTFERRSLEELCDSIAEVTTDVWVNDFARRYLDSETR